ncbi:MAG: hypothetical protein JO306_13410 [Gemmatimonadetes bacterium]|nr:hypothetical protein [Gemmatimonadota bacterium]
MDAWYNTHRASAAPFALLVLLFVSFFTSEGVLANCGGRISGCSSLKGDSVGRLARLDPTNVVLRTLAPLPPEPASSVDTTGIRVKKEADARRQSALKITLARLDRRYVWAFFAGLNGLLSVLSVLVAGLLVRAAPPLGPLGRGTPAVLVVLLASTVFVLTGLVFPDFGMPVMYPMLKATLSSDPSLGMPGAQDVVAFFNGLSNAGALALALTVWLLIRPGPRLQAQTPAAADRAALDQQLANHRRLARWMRIVLYIGTAGLVTGVFRMNATISWAQSFVVPGDDAILDDLRVTMVTVIGAFYSLALVALYLPAMMIIRARARGVIEGSALEPAVKEEVSQQADWSANLKDVLPRVAALLGPLLAGPIGELLVRLAS